MGGKSGHMLHPYEDPEITFQSLIDMFEHAAMGGLEGTIKRDGQNLVVSYSLARDEAVAIRNDDQVYAKGMGLKGKGPEKNFADYLATEDPRFKSFRKGRARNKKPTPPHIVKAFSKALEDLEDVARAMPPEMVIELFGEDADYFYNAEVMSPLSRNAIEYGVDTLSIHRILHHRYDNQERELDTMGARESGQRAGLLDKALQDFYASQEGASDPTPVSVGAMERLAKLEDDNIREAAVAGVKQIAGNARLGLSDTLGRLVFLRFREAVTHALPNIGPDAQKLLIIRMFQEIYGDWEEGEVVRDFGGKSLSEGKVPMKAIMAASTDREPHVNDTINELKNSSKRLHTRIITPLVNIIFEFSSHALATLRDAYVLDRDAEIERTRSKALETIDKLDVLLKPADPNDLKAQEKYDKFLTQKDKILRMQDKISESEGFVFQWPPGSDSTYKFTGTFAPLNQLFGMDPSRWAEALHYSETILLEQKGKSIALYPGKFKPPHAGHFDVAKDILKKPNIDKLIVYISPKPHEGISPEQSRAIWEVYKLHLPGNVEIRVGDVSPVREVYDYLDGEAKSGDMLNLVLGEKDIADGRYARASERRPDVGVNILPVPPQAGGISATVMRQALRDNEEEEFIAGLPSDLKDQEINDILTLLGEHDLYETSGSGAVAGAPGAFGKPFRRDDKENKLVNEVMDYLLGISVG